MPRGGEGWRRMRLAYDGLGAKQRDRLAVGGDAGRERRVENSWAEDLEGRIRGGGDGTQKVCVKRYLGALARSYRVENSQGLEQKKEVLE